MLAVGAAAVLLLALWRAIGTSAPAPARERDRDAAPAVADAPGPPIPMDAEEKGTAVAILPSYDSPIGPPPLPKIRLHGALLRARDREPVGVPTKLKLADEEWEEQETETGGLTEYEFKDLHPGYWELTAVAWGLLTRRASVDLDGKETDVRLDLLLEPACAIRVRLDASLGEWITLVAMDSGLSITGLRESLAETMGERMDWAFKRSIPRTFSIDIVATREEPGRLLDRDGRSQLELGRFRAAGRSTVAPPGSPVRIDVFARSEIPELPPEYCGILETSEPPPLFASLVVNGFVIRSTAVPPGADEVTLTLTRADLEQLPATVRLRIVDAEAGGAAPKLQIRLDEPGPEPPMVRPGPDGSYTIGPTLPGPSTLVINASDREVIEESVSVLPGTNDLGTLRIQPFATLRADVADEERNPAVVSFNIFPMERYDQARKALSLRYFTSSSSGVLDVDSIGRGHYLIVAHDQNWAAMPAAADTSIGQTSRVDIRVSKGTDVALRLRAEPPPNARLSIRTTSGLPVDDRRCRAHETMRFRLAPGLYSLELYDGETWLATERLDVGSEPVRRWFPR